MSEVSVDGTKGWEINWFPRYSLFHCSMTLKTDKRIVHGEDSIFLRLFLVFRIFQWIARWTAPREEKTTQTFQPLHVKLITISIQNGWWWCDERERRRWRSGKSLWIGDDGLFEIRFQVGWKSHFEWSWKTLANNRKNVENVPIFVLQFSREFLWDFHDSQRSLRSLNDAEKFFNWFSHSNVSIEIDFISTAEMKGRNDADSFKWLPWLSHSWEAMTRCSNKLHRRKNIFERLLIKRKEYFLKMKKRYVIISEVKLNVCKLIKITMTAHFLISSCLGVEMQEEFNRMKFLSRTWWKLRKIYMRGRLEMYNDMREVSGGLSVEYLHTWSKSMNI